ncbi:acetolactate synthase [Chlorella sorokiniana]|uniref:Acetolactate synthase n=1 Tax=Chlorella sorokiniana TaxID=3076 RepID=A0A2P6TJ39_CHLSO|nr:acetolactate synthase [Chlorella sorokiniana]|eukprot:PRW39265.1 acetolactate synthase [Chlorella sorokiniana]
MAAEVTGAHVVVQNLIAQGVRRVFVIPGAKIDRVIEVMRTCEELEIVLCRNEQSAAHMAAGHGRRTGRAGVVLVTSGPGVTNLTTALATANCEGDPVVALGGNVSVSQRYKNTHQGLDNVAIMKPVTKYAVEVPCPDSISECITNAFRAAESIGRPGAAFVSLPQSVLVGPAKMRVLGQSLHAGGGHDSDIAKAADVINSAGFPVLLCGQFASEMSAAAALRNMLRVAAMPVVTTFQGAGVVGKDQAELYGGRVGLIHNTLADRLLDMADVVVAVGYDPVEYDVDLWNDNRPGRKIVHIDSTAAVLDNAYVPAVEVVGSIANSVKSLTALLKDRDIDEDSDHCKEIQQARDDLAQAREAHASDKGSPVHPLRLVHDMQTLLDRRDGHKYSLYLDMGSHHIFHARYLQVHHPRQVSFSNGQQTMGVSMPWAISAALDARDPGSSLHHQWSKPALTMRQISQRGGMPTDKRVISISGDGSFLFCAHELETAVRYNLHFVHIVWVDGTLNMVKIQQEKKYGRGNEYAVDLGPLDYVKFAEAFGATGIQINDADEFLPTLEKALEMQGPVVIAVNVDYSQNDELFKDAIQERANGCRTARELVVLNVGGTLFTTTRTTLTTHGESMLAAMFRGDMADSKLTDAAGNPFIDRSPKHFPSILAYLRDGYVPLPEARRDLLELQAEAKYFALAELADLLEEVIQEEEREQAAAQARKDANEEASALVAREHAAALTDAITRLKAAKTALQTASDLVTALQVAEREVRGQWRALDVARGQPGFAARPAQERHQHVEQMNGLVEQMQQLQGQLDGARLASEQAQQVVDHSRSYKLACLGIRPPEPPPAAAAQQQAACQADRAAAAIARIAGMALAVQPAGAPGAGQAAPAGAAAAAGGRRQRQEDALAAARARPRVRRRAEQDAAAAAAAHDEEELQLQQLLEHLAGPAEEQEEGDEVQVVEQP